MSKNSKIDFQKIFGSGTPMIARIVIIICTIISLIFETKLYNMSNLFKYSSNVSGVVQSAQCTNIGCWQLTIQYVVNGNTYTNTIGAPPTNKIYKAGEQVNVLYDPKNPQDSTVSDLDQPNLRYKSIKEYVGSIVVLMINMFLAFKYDAYANISSILFVIIILYVAYSMYFLKKIGGV